MVIRDSLKELPWGQIWGISPRSLLSLFASGFFSCLCQSIQALEVPSL